MKSVAAVLAGGASPFTNPGFETGDITGWTKVPGTVTLYVDAYFARTTPSPSYTYTPQFGTKFLRISSGIGTTGIWQTITQNVVLTAGQVISGKAAFAWGDYYPYVDGGRVRVLQGSTVIATPWLRSGADLSADYDNGPWEDWTFTAPSSGTYTFEYGVVNTTDESYPSFALFDMTVSTVSGCATLPANSSAMLSLLSGYQFFVAELYTITLVNSSIYRLTSGDGDITYGCNLFSVGSVRIQRGDITTAIGVEVSDVEVTLLCNADSLIGSIGVQQFAINGGLDGARIKIEVAIMPTYGDVSAGAVHLFEGIVTDCKPDMSKVVLTVSSDLILLNAMAPKNVYQPTCLHTLFDSQCTLSKAAFTVTSSVLSGSTAIQLLCGLAQATAHFNMGTLTFSFGGNAGASRVVQTYTPGVINLSYPLEHAPAIGDAFSITAGCDKLRATCATKFSNSANFLGFEYMPVPEASA